MLRAVNRASSAGLVGYLLLTSACFSSHEITDRSDSDGGGESGRFESGAATNADSEIRGANGYSEPDAGGIPGTGAVGGVVTDSSGVSFEWSCPSSQTVLCELTPLSEELLPDCNGMYGFVQGGLLGICGGNGSSMGSWGYAWHQCRVVDCDSDRDCPVWDAYDYRCVRRLCQKTDRGSFERHTWELIALCLDSQPRIPECRNMLPTDSTLQHATKLINESCPVDGGICRVPEQCRQP